MGAVSIFVSGSVADVEMIVKLLVGDEATLPVPEVPYHSRVPNINDPQLVQHFLELRFKDKGEEVNEEGTETAV